MVTYLWTPRPRHCTRITKDRAQYRTGMYHKGFKVADEAKRKKAIRHLVTDYAHILPKLHCPWDDTPKNDVNPALLYHGLRSTSVTQRLNPPVPTHSAHPDLRDAPNEWHGRQAQDVTEMYTFMSRGRKPPSREYYHGREATDISDHLRIIPPIAPEGEAQEFYGRPKSDVTDYNIFPPRIEETFSRSDAARPLGKCPTGAMVDYVPLVRDKNGKLLRPQPVSPPKSPSRRHDPNPEPMKPGGGGILAQVVAGHSRSEAKRPLGQCPPGVMANYVELQRDADGKVIVPQTSKILDDPPGWRPDGRKARPRMDENEERIMRYSNDRLHPLGKVPEGVMADYQQVDRPPHKHTTDGLWSPPTEWPKEKGGMAKWSPGPMSQSQSACNAAETLQGASSLLSGLRSAKVCRHRSARDLSPGAAAAQGLACAPGAANVKWPNDGELERGPCGKIKSPCSQRSKSPLSSSANASPTCHGSAKACDPIKHDPRVAKPSSICGGCPKSGDGARPDTACVRPVYIESSPQQGSPSGGKKPPSCASSGRPGSGGSGAGSAKGSCASGGSAGSKASQSANQRKAKKNRVISPLTSPEHYQFPYFGHSKTYVTDPAISPNLTPPGRRSMRLPGQENMPFAGVASGHGKGPKSKCGMVRPPNINPHLHDGKTSWFGRTRTFVTDPAVSPNLTPPNRG
ncbi:hypothetical protein MPTK1_2g03070 [Marchantia polymorpha subsp. ruderalis]|nr:hypothetical protein MARPO_0075s0068 [Marchantia polymorpha]BBN00915.1 hypothetical protein Mp_2g03070 [Marchantia polymorpha subsp. ruderalis]PTQ34970.1 hypothetical protein MARPO_0075s0068 [Marchantia polymorpha]PTQ34971.1 hypothetical protein MARPO_0075s0068 [Marchantia polymorpha]BBN00916.1 hypothetical protein Mp_2g03070 [Marchantia polymorpha subsp. ruderalis]|eukprot:PTQ34969.1 hypothetical protein MARPO_0075s0068 [Marchantia polymorpha]